MKRVLQIILLLAILGTVAQIIITFTKNKHEVEYKIVSNNETFSVKEIFENNKYHVLITNGDTNFSFVTNNSFNKKKKIVDDISFVKENNLMCIYPYLYKSNNFNIICNDNGVIKSYYTLKDNKVVISFVSSLQAKGEINGSWINTNTNTRITGPLTIYYDNIRENSKIYVWKYTGFYSTTKDTDLMLNVATKDVYANSLGIKVNNYYMIPDYNQKYDFTTMIIYNMKNNVIKKIEFDDEISYDSYYNGVVRNNVYLFDKDDLIQYEININKKTYSVVGNKEINALYYDGKFTTRNVYDFATQQIIFKTYNLPQKINAKDKVFKDEDLYFYVENNDIYMYDDRLKTTVLLFYQKNATSIQAENSQLYFIVGDSLYIYDQKNGVKKLITYKEFSFNTENMYTAYDY
ncbi:MAG TPA: hypothetical protein PLT65_05800 [Bacilli bacterium]|nr:hypothetical protein [Bacilli bacterium]